MLQMIKRFCLFIFLISISFFTFGQNKLVIPKENKHNISGKYQKKDSSETC